MHTFPSPGLLLALAALGLAAAPPAARAQGTYLGQFGSAGFGDGQFTSPTGVAVAANGTVYVTDYGKSRVEYFSSNGTYGGQIGMNGNGNGQFSAPQGISFSGNTLYVTDTGNARIQFFDITPTPESSAFAVFGLGVLGLGGLVLRARRRKVLSV